MKDHIDEIRRKAATEDERRARARRVAIMQGTYYIATGIWPILHMDSFEATTGRKRDKWLVKTIGALVGAMGL